MRGPDAPVRPEVLRWARETAGIDPDEAAHRIGRISPSRLLEAEAGGPPLTLGQARKAAEVYERPLAVLFLPAPLEEESPELQFRRFRGAPALPWPPAMRALARQVPALQDEVNALLEALEEEPRWPEVAQLLQSEDDVARAAANLRVILGVRLEAQKAAARSDPQGFRAFRLWREAVEDLGILVLQDSSLSSEEMRGFASPHDRIPAVVINTNDVVKARMFTLFHELGELFRLDRTDEEHERLAGAALMPAEPFAADFRAAEGTLLEKVDRLARTYATTPDATAVRVGWLELAAWPAVNRARAEIARRRGGSRPRQGGNYYRNVIARLGPRLVGRVLEAVDQSSISELAAARMLGVRVGAFEKLRAELGGTLSA